MLERLNSALSAAEVKEPDWLLPVPLSAERLRERGVDPLPASQLRGASVALLDDVMTSGATLFELTRVVLQPGR